MNAAKGCLGFAREDSRSKALAALATPGVRGELVASAPRAQHRSRTRAEQTGPPDARPKSARRSPGRRRACGPAGKHFPQEDTPREKAQGSVSLGEERVDRLAELRVRLSGCAPPVPLMRRGAPDAVGSEPRPHCDSLPVLRLWQEGRHNHAINTCRTSRLFSLDVHEHCPKRFNCLLVRFGRHGNFLNLAIWTHEAKDVQAIRLSLEAVNHRLQSFKTVTLKRRIGRRRAHARAAGAGWSVHFKKAGSLEGRGLRWQDPTAPALDAPKRLRRK